MIIIIIILLWLLLQTYFEIIGAVIVITHTFMNCNETNNNV